MLIADESRRPEPDAVARHWGGRSHDRLEASRVHHFARRSLGWPNSPDRRVLFSAQRFKGQASRPRPALHYSI